jgi:gamma-tubulin complex component 5
MLAKVGFSLTNSHSHSDNCPGTSQIVSLLALQSQLEPLISPFGSLCRIITSLNNSSHLEQLYLAACALQSTGDMPSYAFIATIFFSCLRTYLRPIRRWMEAGHVPPTGDFLISQSAPDDSVELGTFWHSQFQLRRTPHGSLNAPSFVHPVAQRILTTGKSVIFLKHLLPSSASVEASVNDHVEITFSDVCFPGTELAPFASLFLAAFNRWIGARHHSISARLRQHLFENCGLWRSLDALDLIFFARNGFLFETLAQGVFEKLDRKAATWSDRFLLTEQIQSVFSSAHEIDPHRLRMGVKKTDLFSRATRKDAAGRKTVDSLENIEVDYRLPWPVLNIIQPASSFPTYRRVFTFLLQLRRARYLLERLRNGDVAEKSFFALKQRFLWFSSVIVQYLTDLVLRPTTAALKRDLANADDVDAMVAVHAAFVEKVREQCLLGTKLAPIHGGIVAVLNLAVKFARVHDAFHHSPQDTGASPRSRRRRRDDDSSDEEDAESAPPGSPSSTGVTSIFGEDDVGADGEVVDEEHRYGLKMEKIMEELMGLVGFVKDGLRGVARAGVMPHLEMLAEALDGYGGGGGWAGI